MCPIIVFPVLEFEIKLALITLHILSMRKKKSVLIIIKSIEPLPAAYAVREKRCLAQDLDVHDRAWVRQDCCPVISVYLLVNQAAQN